MTILTEGQHNGEYFVSEANESRSRDAITLAVDAAMYMSGTVLKATAGVYERFDGTGTAVAILYHDTDATEAVADAVAHTRDMEYKLPKLVFNSDATQTHIDAAVASLATVGIIARDAN